MRVWRRRVVTVAVAGLLLVGGCTAAPRGAPPVDPVAPMVGAAPVRVPLPAAEAKSVHGPVRRAAWLGGGLLAVWGHDDSEPVVRGSVVEQWSRPAGLRVVDTRTWRAVTVHANAGEVAVAGGRLLAWGRLLGPPPSADVNVPAVRAFGLMVFGPGDRRPLHLFGSRQVSWLQVSGGRAYVDLTPSSDWWVGGDVLAADREVAVVDLGSGRVLAEWRGRMPALLVGGCCDGPVGG